MTHDVIDFAVSLKKTFLNSLLIVSKHLKAILDKPQIKFNH